MCLSHPKIGVNLHQAFELSAQRARRVLQDLSIDKNAVGSYAPKTRRLKGMDKSVTRPKAGDTEGHTSNIYLRHLLQKHDIAGQRHDLDGRQHCYLIKIIKYVRECDHK